MSEPCRCGALDCKWCYPTTWREALDDCYEDEYDYDEKDEVPTDE